MSTALASSVAMGSDVNKVIINDLSDPIPDLPIEPPLWKIFAMPVKMRRASKGGIIFAEDTVDVQLWHHQLYRIIKVGKQVYRGPGYQGYEIADEDIPKPGQIWLVSPKMPDRFGYDGQTIIVLNDDQLRGRVTDESCIAKLKFFGFELG